MDLLCRVSSFSDIEDVKYFFQVMIKERDKQLETGDTIYFMYDNYIVVQAIFTGEKCINKDRDEEYIYGYELKNIKLIDSENRLNSKKIIFHDLKYINTSELSDEIKRLIYIDDNKLDENEKQNYPEGSKKQITVR